MPTVRSNGIDLHYEEAGEPTAPAILLVMGLATQLIAWPDALVDRLVAAGFRVIREWDKTDCTGNTSVYRYTIGAHADALDHLKKDYPAAMRQVRNEQEYVTLTLARQGRLGYWPEAWCRSFKRHCLQPGLMGWFKPPQIPEGARIIAFHGKPNPPDAIAGESGKWYRKVLPTQWVADHWQ